jgi:hypothetical protein
LDQTKSPKKIGIDVVDIVVVESMFAVVNVVIVKSMVKREGMFAIVNVDVIVIRKDLV